MPDVDEPETLIFAEGQLRDRIPWGEGSIYQTFEEQVSTFEEDVDRGGTLDFPTEDVRGFLDSFRQLVDPEKFDARECPDCGAGVGELHNLGCGIEECPNCGKQLLVCPCGPYELADRLGQDY